ncbi:uncharacterized protein LOC110434616 [Sorghum bicolor]|uniref:uncharacterized protein LOC110434616 n=1 Tax=Sorghum bicolor TaxID=4558 RepID=UPI000B423D24|nr:uncharacterized protein LOC110434616 [Sorghum bicolor]|eukprot:XP_021314674.1 uncharacterized protein LOC110434616 [Sorghum bicolor]
MELEDVVNELMDSSSSSSSSSDDDDEVYAAAEHIILSNIVNPACHRGSVEGHRVVNRDRQSGHCRLYEDYFSDNPTYGPSYFRRRFRMRRHVFVRIMNAIEMYDDYFVQKRNAAGTLGLSCLQKVVAAFRMLAYGVAADAMDDYIRIGETTALESLRKFVRAIVKVFGHEYLRLPNEDDTARLLEIGESRGFPGMLGSIDCMHWTWKNCPYAWQGSHNDLNVLQRSPIFARLAEGQGPQVNYSINGNSYTMGYYLADGIYPSWATFVKTIPEPQGNKNKYFAKAQEACRKDVERAFGVLQARFAIVQAPARVWDEDTIQLVMTACIIMHNMIVEDEGVDEKDFKYDDVGEKVTVSHDATPKFDAFMQNYKKIKDKETHTALQADLIEHLWHNFPDLYTNSTVE